MLELSANFKVVSHTPGTVKFDEVDENGEKTRVLSGGLYLQKGAVGTLPIGTIVTMTVKVPVKS